VLARLAVAELRKLASSKGLRPKGMSKAELVAALEAVL